MPLSAQPLEADLRPVGNRQALWAHLHPKLPVSNNQFMLNFPLLTSQLPEILKELQTQKGKQGDSLEEALNIFEKSGDLSEVKQKYLRDEAKVTWLIGLPAEDLKRTYPLVEVRNHYSVAATDGSGFELSRHEAVQAYLINTGQVHLKYGEDSVADLENKPELYYKEEDLIVGKKAKRNTIKATHIDLKRDLTELRELYKLAKSKQVDLALVDGSLIRWTLESTEDYFKQAYLKDYLETLSQFKEARIALASYISASASTESTNFLRILVCPYDPINCDKCKDLPCAKVEGVLDRFIFEDSLKVGERSILFESRSKILKEYAEHKIHFFYLNVGSEIARIELPQYVAEDQELLSQVHSLVFDQAQKGKGYPVSLMEAHEQAVVKTRDKELFFQMIEKELVKSGRVIKKSEKSGSKRRKWL